MRPEDRGLVSQFGAATSAIGPVGLDPVEPPGVTILAGVRSLDYPWRTVFPFRLTETANLPGTWPLDPPLTVTPALGRLQSS